MTPAAAPRTPARVGGRCWWRHGVLVLALAPLPQCEGAPYPLRPTPCDDWCFALQRADCAEDYPDICVTECERTLVPAIGPSCADAWRTLTTCYRNAPGSEFVCSDFRSKPMDICLPERLGLAECISPATALCYQDCEQQANACGGIANDCEGRCLELPDACEQVARVTYQCSLAAERSCQNGDVDMRPLDEIPCLVEVGDLFDCSDRERHRDSRSASR